MEAVSKIQLLICLVNTHFKFTNYWSLLSIPSLIYFLIFGAFFSLMAILGVSRMFKRFRDPRIDTRIINFIMIMFGVEFILLIAAWVCLVIYLEAFSRGYEESVYQGWRNTTLVFLACNISLKVPNQLLSIIYSEILVIRYNYYVSRNPNNIFAFGRGRNQRQDQFQHQEYIHRQKTNYRLRMIKLPGTNFMDINPQVISNNGQPHEDEIDTCGVCYRDGVLLNNAVFLNCGHCEICNDCALQSIQGKSTCPFCRNDIEKVLIWKPRNGTQEKTIIEEIHILH